MQNLYGTKDSSGQPQSVFDAPATQLDVALAYAEAGTPIFPVSINKVPLCGEGGFYNATTSPDTITGWFTKYPYADIAMPTGEVSGYDVVDIDMKHGRNGFRAVPEYMSLSPVMSSSPTGGVHLFFEHTSGIPNQIDQFAPGVEIKSDGAYVVLPSPGSGREWIKGSIPADELPPVPGRLVVPGGPPKREPAPEWLRDVMQRRPELAGLGVSTDAADLPPPVSQEAVELALDTIPNVDMDRGTWNRIGMSAFVASEGAAWGCDAFERFSKKSPKHATVRRNGSTPRRTWRGYEKTEKRKGRRYWRTTVGTLFYFASKADPNWRDGLVDEATTKAEGPSTQTDESETETTDHKANAWLTDIVSVRLADVEAKHIDWAWHQRIARGKITILSGDPGVSKSMLSIDLAARMTTGAEWPDGSGKAPRGWVIILSAEDDVADTIRVRFAAAGGDATKCHVLQAVKVKKEERIFDLTRDLPSLQRMIEDLGDVVAIIVDPVNAYMGRPGKLDSFRDTDLRGVLTPLAKLAADTRVAVIGIVHLTKDGRRSALMSVMGSVAMGAAARSVFLVIEDVDDPDRILFLRTKTNIARKQRGTGLAYKIHERPTGLDTVPYAPGIVWETDGVDITADEALAANRAANDGRRNPDIDKAGNMINEMLANGPMPASEIQERLKAQGFSPSTCRNARTKYSVEVYQQKIPGPWFWRIVM